MANSIPGLYCLEPRCWQAFKRLITRIDFYAHGLERGHAQQWLRVRFTIHNCSADNFTHKLDVTGCYVEPDLAAVGQAIYPLSLGFESDGLKVRPGDK